MQDFYEANLNNSNFEGAKLYFANFCGAMLNYANFENARLNGANFRNASLNNANLINAHLAGARLYRAYLKNTDLRGATLKGGTGGDGNVFSIDAYGGEADISLLEAKRQGAIINDQEEKPTETVIPYAKHIKDFFNDFFGADDASE